MDNPNPTETSWSARIKGVLSRWKKRWQPEPATRVLNLEPPCSQCGQPTAAVMLSEYPDRWHLRFQGVAGHGNGQGDDISGEKARAILGALSPPYELAKIRAAGFYDDFGYCTPCEKFYCSTHWQVSTTGGGTCPEGHFKSLDPHWHPDEGEL